MTTKRENEWDGTDYWDYVNWNWHLVLFFSFWFLFGLFMGYMFWGYKG